MIPGQIFTSFAKFQGIVNVNDFRLPLGSPRPPVAGVPLYLVYKVFFLNTTFREGGAYFGMQKTFFGIQNLFLGYKIFFCDTKNFFWDTKNFLVDQNPRTSHILQKNLK